MPPNRRLPKVFIGSSKEALPELTYISDALKRYASVFPWTKESMFPAGQFFLESLLQQAPTFDFAVFIFAADDVQTSRGLTQAVPRDNVIFETGLFMSHLGRERTLVVAPKGSELPLRVMSDFAGLSLMLYEVPKDRAMLGKALESVSQQIAQRIKEKRLRLASQPGPVLGCPGPQSYPEALGEVQRLIDDSLKESGCAWVRNIALDMEHTWGWLRDQIIRDSSVRNLRWQSLMVDPNSQEIRDMASDDVSPKRARAAQESIVEVCEEWRKELERRKVRFECRAYANPPVVHGFLVDSETLLFGLCGVKEGKLLGNSFYWTFNKASEPRADFLEAFTDWFDYRWERAKERKVWPR